MKSKVQAEREFYPIPGYSQPRVVGVGAFGIVFAAKEDSTNQFVAIKKIQLNTSTVNSMRIYREFSFLKNLKHENVISLIDCSVSPSNDLYMITELMQTDLSQLLATSSLEVDQIRYFTYQILRALKYVHSVGVLHRDLKPANILINTNCDLKVCDFGFARNLGDIMTGYVSTRYYRAPEIILNWQNYGCAIDIWSVGCILVEMIEGRVLFPGKDFVDQFGLIIELLGTPEDTQGFMDMIPHRDPINFKARFLGIDTLVVDLIEKLIEYNSNTRITSQEALRHQWFDDFHDSDDEPDSEDTVKDWAFLDQSNTPEEWKVLFRRESTEFHKEMTQ